MTYEHPIPNTPNVPRTPNGSYRFERLEKIKVLSFPVSDGVQVERTRQAAYQYARNKGWKVRTALDGEGNLLVARLEHVALLPSPSEIRNKRKVKKEARLTRKREKRAAKIARKYAEG